MLVTDPTISSKSRTGHSGDQQSVSSCVNISTQAGLCHSGEHPLGCIFGSTRTPSNKYRSMRAEALSSNTKCCLPSLFPSAWCPRLHRKRFCKVRRWMGGKCGVPQLCKLLTSTTAAILCLQAGIPPALAYLPKLEILSMESAGLRCVLIHGDPHPQSMLSLRCQ
jgi:hypothetical protein